MPTFVRTMPLDTGSSGLLSPVIHGVKSYFYCHHKNMPSEVAQNDASTISSDSAVSELTDNSVQSYRRQQWVENVSSRLRSLFD